jgi:hypothetical protein
LDFSISLSNVSIVACCEYSVDSLSVFFEIIPSPLKNSSSHG